MAWNEKLTALNYVLASLYPLRDESIRIVNEAGLRPAFIRLENKAVDNWHNILDEADKANRILNVIQVARGDYPENVVLIQAENAERENRPSLSNFLHPH